MPKTVSVHNGSAANREHNRRNPRTTGQMPHIQQDLVHHNETWIDIPVREAYKQIFQTAVDDYNRRQSRPERKIRDYYNQIRKSAKKRTAYELIIQIGDKNDTGLSADNEIACLREYYNARLREGIQTVFMILQQDALKQNVFVKTGRRAGVLEL